MFYVFRGRIRVTVKVKVIVKVEEEIKQKIFFYG